jgi:hypothetical protein
LGRCIATLTTHAQTLLVRQHDCAFFDLGLCVRNACAAGRDDGKK